MTIEKVVETTVIHKPGWLEVWTCDGCAEDESFLVVYRSPLVKYTSDMYEPVARMLLGASSVEVIAEEECEDPNMMFGKGVTLLLSLKGVR